MIRRIACFVFILLPAAFAMSDSRADDEAKAVAGMSIVGNSEAPKALYIVPWKSPAAGNDDNKDAGKAGKFDSKLLHDGLAPVDNAVFMRELDLYKQSNSN